jgi:hypothetical protein
MFLFSFKLEKYIRKQVLPKILLNPRAYIIKGSFKRRVPYVTDIDIVNDIQPRIPKDQLYDHIRRLVMNLPTEIILLQLTCGTDDRFRLKTGSDEEINIIKQLISTEDQIELNKVIEQYSDPQERFFFINEIVWPYYKIRFWKSEVLDNRKILAGGLEVTVTEMIAKNKTLTMQYSIIIGDYSLGADIAVYYDTVNEKEIYGNARSYYHSLSNYKKEYYYMLFPLRHYFRKNATVSKEINDLIEKKFGLFKQLAVRIDNYHLLYSTNNLNIGLASKIVKGIIHDTNSLINFKSGAVNDIRQISMNNSPEVKIKEWDILLELLREDIELSANNQSKKFFYHYLALVPRTDQSKFITSENMSESEKSESENETTDEQTESDTD